MRALISSKGHPTYRCRAIGNGRPFMRWGPVKGNRTLGSVIKRYILFPFPSLSVSWLPWGEQLCFKVYPLDVLSNHKPRINRVGDWSEAFESEFKISSSSFRSSRVFWR